ncbi:hypothetical protein [Roseisolibacter sp. H3M3-2]|uniref:hypothetical protein n=1 Tax=Roseisolibacter sp. H3M3-2 TaxID=3031323 RepID=UPI0023D9CF94|nr:hypothetical protein [Roseisolibacter sp. H3M3-2]MDF1501838.1 hypothetical protein [Roseisolibacter sp. H3M3-2]
MAEIEFKRRGTPLWLVLLVLAVLGGAAWFFVRQRPEAPVAQTAADSAAAPAGSPAAAAPAAPAPTGPSVNLARFADSASLPGADAEQRRYLSQAMRLMADVLQEKAPTNGVQQSLLRAVADTLAMADTRAERVADLTQLGFFAYAYALNDAKVDDGKLSTAASQMQPNVAVGRQKSIVDGYLRLSRDILRGVASKGADTIPAPRTSTPTPAPTGGDATPATPKSGD